MKKLIALFAILVAMTSFSFAATGTATATVNAYTAIEVTVSASVDNPNILVGGGAVATFTGSFTFDAGWGGTFLASWAITSHTGGTWTYTDDAAPVSVTDGSARTFTATLSGATAGANTAEATYTVDYAF